MRNISKGVETIPSTCRNQCKDLSCVWMKHESDCNKGGKEYLFSQLYAHGTEQQVLSMSNGAQNSLLWAQLPFTSPQELPPGLWIWERCLLYAADQQQKNDYITPPYSCFHSSNKRQLLGLVRACFTSLVLQCSASSKKQGDKGELIQWKHSGSQTAQIPEMLNL